MISDTPVVMLAKSQDACLAALRKGKISLNQIAMRSGLTAKRASLALTQLESLGLAERSPEKVWRTTSRGETCLVSVAVHDGSHEGRREPSPNGRRLLELLDQPTEGRGIAKKLGLSRQGAINVMRRLCAQGHLRFGTPMTHPGG